MKQISLKTRLAKEESSSFSRKEENSETTSSYSILNHEKFYDIELESAEIEGETDIDDSSDNSKSIIRGQRRGSLIHKLARSQGVTHLSHSMHEDNEKNQLSTDRHTLSEFVQNVNRRISQTKQNLKDEILPVSNNSSNHEDKERDSNYDETTNSLRFYYNFDMDDNSDVDETATSCYEETLPEIFDDGNFKLVDGLIALVEKPVGKKSDFVKSSILLTANTGRFRNRIVKCGCTKKENNTRAA